MKTRKYHGYLYVIAYLMILRIVLNITVGISFISTGTVLDLVMMMFWVSAIGFFMKSLVSQKVFYILVVVFATLFVLGDSVYYDYFGAILTRSSIDGLKWLKEGNVTEYSIKIPLVVYLTLPFTIFTSYLIISNKKRDVFYIKDFGFLSIFFLIQVALFLTWENQEFDSKIDYYRSDAYLFESMHDRSLYSEKYGYYHYHLLDLTRIMNHNSTDSYPSEVTAFFENKEPHQINAYSDLYQGYNVVTILAETLETRFINETLTPTLYMMKENGITFSNYYTTVFQQGATCNSEYMSLTGLAAITTNDSSNNICDAYIENQIPYALPNQLKELGYQTYYFHSGYEWFYNRNQLVPQYGFDTVKFQEDLIEGGYLDYNDRFDTEMMYFLDEFFDPSELFHLNLLTYSMHGAYNQVEFEKHADHQ